MTNNLVIKVEHLTKDYGEGRGIFDLSFEVKKGEAYGFIGTNGSGKTTTIRNIMGFIQAKEGNISVLGMNAWKQSIKIKQYVSYVPGEIAFPNLASGTQFLKLQAEYLGMTDFSYMNHLIKLFQLDPTANLKRMSKGMKQKTALVAALMGNRDILILDEPTTGLDPLMREVFLELMRTEKAKGKTIFISSHIFEEIEDVCDRAAMIKDGKLVDVIDVHALRHGKEKQFMVVFEKPEDKNQFVMKCDYARCMSAAKDLSCEVLIESLEIEHLLHDLSKYRLHSLSENHETLEQRFKNTFEREEEGWK